MRTIVTLTPADHGRPMSEEDFDHARGQEGSRYELIDGRVYVSPQPDLPHDRISEWLDGQLDGYRREHPEVVNYISLHARVYVPDRPETTNPEPDLAGFQDFPKHLPLGEINWRDISPILVAEIISEDDPDKDLVRNVELYQDVPSIREYWILDPRDDPDRPTLRVYRRRGHRWQKPIDVAPGETYTTRLLPGFTLRVDPRTE